jgi:hypothetical protein
MYACFIIDHQIFKSGIAFVSDLVKIVEAGSVKGLVIGASGVGLILFSLYMFIGSVQLLEAGRVASSLLSALIGFSTLSGGVALVRSWAVSKVEKNE